MIFSTLKVFRNEEDAEIIPLVLKEYEVIFGASKKMKEAVNRIKEYENPDVIMFVTSCVLEFIGEDYSQMIREIQKEGAIPILIVNMEHYYCLKRYFLYDICEN